MNVSIKLVKLRHVTGGTAGGAAAMQAVAIELLLHLGRVENLGILGEEKQRGGDCKENKAEVLICLGVKCEKCFNFQW